MKRLLPLLLLLAACCKEETKEPDDMYVPGLPAVSQHGANTLGFLLNGQPWTPEGPNNLSIDYDPGFNSGIVGIVAYRRINANSHSSFALGTDSLNFTVAPRVFNVKIRSVAGFNFTDSSYCSRIHFDTSTYRKGHITISKLDRNARIIAGTFEVTLFNPSCGDTIRITKGRFDHRF